MKKILLFVFLIASCVAKGNATLLFEFRGNTPEHEVYLELKNRGLSWEVAEDDKAYEDIGYTFKTIHITELTTKNGVGEFSLSFFNKHLLSTRFCQKGQSRQELLELLQDTKIVDDNVSIVGLENQLCIIVRDPVVNKKLSTWLEKHS
jgi:hypothetical protein